jgi:hypothetical protein
MGWSGGSEMAEEIWRLVGGKIAKPHRKRVARALISIFENQDCDTIDECDALCKAAGRTWNDETGDIVYR